MTVNRYTAVLPNGHSVTVSDFRRYTLVKCSVRQGDYVFKRTDDYVKARDVLDENDTKTARAEGWRWYLWDNQAGPFGAVIDSTDVRVANGR